MKVLKFGSKSLATVENLKTVANIIDEKQKTIVIISAMPQVTSALEDISDYLYRKNLEGANEILNKLEKTLHSIISSLYTSDQIVAEATEFIQFKITYLRSFTNELFTLFEKRIVLAQGEIITTTLFYLLLKERNYNPIKIDALEVIRMDKNSEPEFIFIKEKLSGILNEYPDNNLYITEGYICNNAYGEIDDLGKGGSDYTASLIGSAINAKEIQIWSNADSLYTNDPIIVNNSTLVENINFEEAAELAYFGAKIPHPSSILPAKLANIAIRLLNIEQPENKGTLISDSNNKDTIKAIATKDGIIAIKIKSGRMLLAHGFLRKVFEVFELYKTSIDMLTTSEVGISVTIDNPRNLDNIVNDLKKHGTVSVSKDMTIVCAVGAFDWKNITLKSKIFDATKNIPIRMISYGGSNHNISFLIQKEDKESTLIKLNQQLF